MFSMNMIASAEAQTILSGSRPTEKKKLKPCCVCKETKKARDLCVLENGEINCSSYIEAHKACMRSMGFNI
ncbi:cytochrome c oxidase copper chaperone [Homalodisca vitripennis]|uniref:cytochrome c oxidase copper chaperone n=1 Tax=Homalodisca vitripennis TaxID=197043 RepID=UPI001EEC26ED|nr:cytochrome c oxidase copper chaperone [Homalodisca vitripennis]